MDILSIKRVESCTHDWFVVVIWIAPIFFTSDFHFTLSQLRASTHSEFMTLSGSSRLDVEEEETRPSGRRRERVRATKRS